MENNQKLEELKQILDNGGIALIPSDTIWGMSSFANDDTFTKLSRIKQRDESKTMILLMTEEMFPKYISYNYSQFNFEYPTSIIYPKEYITEHFIKNISSKIIRDDGSIGVRIVYDKNICDIISYLDKPIISTSANISGNPSPINLEDIDKNIVDMVDYIYHIDGRQPKTKPSTVIKIDGDQIIYLRK